MKPERLHKIRLMQLPIVVMLGVWSLFLLSFGVAWWRVSRKQEFPDTPFHSFPLDRGVLNDPQD